MSKKTITEFVSDSNLDKKLFTAGPASLLDENLSGLMPCFGRGDSSYLNIENQVLSDLKNDWPFKIARLQGSASLLRNNIKFSYGRVLAVNTGYYSERMFRLSQDAMVYKNITEINSVAWKEISNVTDNYDWIIACPTETSCGLKLPINDLFNLAQRCNAKLMLDATASIGLESGHEQADVLAYSSCKGLFGLTGAAFIAFNELPNFNPDSFYLDLTSHMDRKMTGPYHAIASLSGVLRNHRSFREAEITNHL